MLQAHWIRTPWEMGLSAPLFRKTFHVDKELVSASLRASARGVYEAFLGGVRIGNAVLMPGWTVFEKRILVQEYDVTSLLREENVLELRLAAGWYAGTISTGSGHVLPPEAQHRSCAVIAELELCFADGSHTVIGTDESWLVAESGLSYCDIYNGLVYDATVTPAFCEHAVISENDDRSVLIPAIGEPVLPHERLKPIAVIHTPKGETVLDFGQNVTGTVALSLSAHAGDRVSLSFAEVLDSNGNFYNANYRAAACRYDYTCCEGPQEFFPTLTFYGFRYVRVDAFPGTPSDTVFTAVVLHSRLRRTGNIETSDPLLNRLFRNILWGQRDNYLDIPTDCPQRDERLGWTGDAQVFIGAACYNFDVREFFRKWLLDLRDSQRPNGSIPVVIPDVWGEEFSAAAWSDAVTIIPWKLYQFYGDTDFLETTFPAMTRWVEYITAVTPSYPLWTDHFQYGDWLGLDAAYGEYRGASREDLVATAFYAHSAELVCQIGHLLGKDVARYETLHREIVAGFKAAFDGDYRTQTEHVLALHFGLTDDRAATAASLAAMIERDGVQLKTGFVGTPYLLHVLSENGYTDLAYRLLLRREFPSWLYPVTQGATTMWEHWDCIRPDGAMWSDGMNSFNHYAYGAVADWMYGVCAGIQPEEPGFRTVRFCPHPTNRLERFAASLKTDQGTVSSRWWHENGTIRYELITPCPAVAVIDGTEHTLAPGRHRF